MRFIVNNLNSKYQESTAYTITIWYQIPHLNFDQISNIRRALVGNKIVDYSDVVRASPVGAAPTTSILDLTPGFNGLGKDNYKTGRESFKFWDLVRFVLEICGTSG